MRRVFCAIMVLTAVAHPAHAGPLKVLGTVTGVRYVSKVVAHGSVVAARAVADAAVTIAKAAY